MAVLPRNRLRTGCGWLYQWSKKKKKIRLRTHPSLNRYTTEKQSPQLNPSKLSQNNSCSSQRVKVVSIFLTGRHIACMHNTRPRLLDVFVFFAFRLVFAAYTYHVGNENLDTFQVGEENKLRCG